MSTALNLILFLIIFALLVTISVFAAIGAADVNKITSDQVRSAYHYLVWASVIGWISVFLIVVAVILYFIFGSFSIGATGGLVVMTLLGFVLVTTIVVGVLCIIAATKLHNQTGADAAYRNALIASLVSVLGLGIIIVALIAFWIGHKHGKVLVQGVDIEKARQTALARLAATPSPTPSLPVADVTSPKVALTAVPVVAASPKPTSIGSIPSPLPATTRRQSRQSRQARQEIESQISQLRALLATQ